MPRPRPRPLRRRSGMPSGRRPGLTTALCLLLGVALLVTPAGAAPAPAAAAAPGTRLYLVVLDDAAAPAGDGWASWAAALGAVHRQDEVLATLGAPRPVYRYTAALDGVAVRLSPEQAARAAARPGVAHVEPSRVVRLASHRSATTSALGAVRAPRGPGGPGGGRGVTIGMVDTGLAPESPLFADRGDTGAAGAVAPGGCATAPDWSASACNGKVVAARWFLRGFGLDRLRAAATPSSRDTDGHGTQTASIALGNAGVPVRVRGERLGRFSGVAPQARLAIYKACWSAPDPRDDGCAGADVVAAVDQAVRDDVDVLSLSVADDDRPTGGPDDALQRALLGAAEAGIVVVAAAGNRDRARAERPLRSTAPWVVTVGAARSEVSRGRVELTGGLRLTGVMTSTRRVGPARLLLGARVRARGASAEAARACTPGSLDAARVRGAIVVCERGRVGRIDKSRAVDLADGVGMVLVNRRGSQLATDVHAVPTVQLPAAAGRRLVAVLAQRPGSRGRLVPRGPRPTTVGVPRWSAAGPRDTGVLKPDVVAPGVGVLAAVPESRGRWSYLSGTSAATAYVAGTAAVLLGRGLRPDVVRSALATTAAPVRAADLRRAGSGLVRPRAAQRPGLALLVPPARYRAWLADPDRALNTTSIVLDRDHRTLRRTLTNVSGRRLYFSSGVRGLGGRVSITPAAVRLGPGERAEFEVRRRGPLRADEGWVVWRGATGTVTRLPVLLTRR